MISTKSYSTNLQTTERKDLIKNFSNVVADRIEDRNPNNLLD
jgi:hypothetical protein